MLSKRVTVLNNAQILALPAAPLALTPPYENKVILPIHFDLIFNWVANVTGIDGGSTRMHLNWDGGTDLNFPVCENGILAPGEPVYYGTDIDIGANADPAAGIVLSNVLGEAIVLNVVNGLNFTGGNVLNQLILQVTYMLIPAVVPK